MSFACLMCLPNVSGIRAPIFAALLLIAGPTAGMAKCLYTNPDTPLTLPDITPKPVEPVNTNTTTAPGTPPAPQAVGFAYHPPGDLNPRDKGRGRVGDRKVYIPDMVFPLRLQPGIENKAIGPTRQVDQVAVFRERHRHQGLYLQIAGHGILTKKRSETGQVL